VKLVNGLVRTCCCAPLAGALVVALLGTAMEVSTVTAQEPHAEGGLDRGGGGGVEAPSVRAVGDLTVVQRLYGDGGGGVVVSWTNSEPYDSLLVSVDGKPAATIFGSDASVALDGITPGEHGFGVEARVGSSASAVASTAFPVLAATPVSQPIVDASCEFIAERGGRFELSWTLGASAWVAGLVEIDGVAAAYAIDALATELRLDSVGLEPGAVRLRFRNEAGYFSEAIEPACTVRVPNFRRGDCDNDGRVTITDSIFELDHLFRGGARWYCDDACDANDDGATDLSDAVSILRALFVGGAAAPALLLSAECTYDQSDDFLGGVCSCP